MEVVVPQIGEDLGFLSVLRVLQVNWLLESDLVGLSLSLESG
jgi:hypothetical protein